MEEKRQGLSSFALKRVAVISMIIDHVGSIFIRGMLEPLKVDGVIGVGPGSPQWVRWAFLGREVCEILGSIAFPIFCFLMAEGFIHTRDRKKYTLRMLLFALLSEVPFDLAHYHTFFRLSLQNVMFTLTVSLLTLMALDWAERRAGESKGLYWALTAVITAAGMTLAYLIRGEYVFLGVLTVALLYLLRDKGKLRLLSLVPLLVASPWILLAVPFLLAYNGSRGKGSKWFFYVFYPVHFLALAALAQLAAGLVTA